MSRKQKQEMLSENISQLNAVPWEERRHEGSLIENQTLGKDTVINQSPLYIPALIPAA